jgi:hypothetical protein
VGYATVEILPDRVRKTFKAGKTQDAEFLANRHARELLAYSVVPFATPKLLASGDDWIESELCTPILKVPNSRKYLDSLRLLLHQVHDAGWWHGDAALVNVVVHPERGVLLIDWEALSPAAADRSYDLYGPRAVGVQPIWTPDGYDDGVWWNEPWDICPGKYWR